MDLKALGGLVVTGTFFFYTPKYYLVSQKITCFGFNVPTLKYCGT